MGNGEHLETFSLDASHLHPGRTHWHPWNRQTSDILPFLQKPLDRRSRNCPSMTTPCTTAVWQEAC